MKKNYKKPSLREISLEAEQMIAGSMSNGTQMGLSDESVDTQLTNQKDPDIWGNESVWK